jgi:HK97 family phage major capsid protein
MKGWHTMPNKQALLQRSEELRTEVISKTADFEAGKISSAEFKTYMDACEAETEDIGVGLKTLSAAKRWSGAAEPMPSGEPPKPEVPDYVQKYRDDFMRLKSSADVSTRRREAVTFDFGMKALNGLGMKAQGVAGMSGESTSGTSVPSALAGGTYFLAGTAGPFIAPEFVPGIVELQFYQNAIASLIPTFAVSSPVVTYVRESTWTNNAAAVLEGATKPTSTHSFQRFTEQIGKIANLERVADELVQDAPALWSLIQQRLVQGVQRKEEVELLAGSGYPGVSGLLNRTTGFTAPQVVTAVTNLVVPAAGTAGIGAGTDTVASVTPGRAVIGTGTTGTPPTGLAIAEGIFNALTDIRVKTFFEPDAIVMNPLDYLTVRLAKDTNQQYYGGSMFGADYGYPATQGGSVNAVSRFGLWAKPVVTTPALPAGFILVGDFASYNRVLRLGGLRVDISNSNGTDFEQNLWTARAEERVGLMVERPELFELIQLKNAP